MKLSILIVNWNTRDMLNDCLHSVYATLGSMEAEVIVVDNASEDDSVDMVLEVQSLHRPAAYRECARLLREGGFLLGDFSSRSERSPPRSELPAKWRWMQSFQERLPSLLNCRPWPALDRSLASRPACGKEAGRESAAGGSMPPPDRRWTSRDPFLVHSYRTAVLRALSTHEQDGHRACADAARTQDLQMHPCEWRQGGGER